MSKDKPIRRVANLGKPFWIKAATKVVDIVFKRTVTKGQDVDGAKFDAYDSKYATRKSSGKIKDQAGGAGRSSKPNLYLSSDMMNSLLVVDGSVTDYNINVGWVNPKMGGRVEYNEDNNRYIKKDSGFPFGRAVERIWFRDIDRELDRKLKKVSSKKVIKIG